MDKRQDSVFVHSRSLDLESTSSLFCTLSYPSIPIVVSDVRSAFSTLCKVSGRKEDVSGDNARNKGLSVSFSDRRGACTARLARWTKKGKEPRESKEVRWLPRLNQINIQTALHDRGPYRLYRSQRASR
jgi:hypothetical protein